MLSAELARSTVVKSELVEELTRVQGRQRDVATQMEASEDQLKRLDNQFKQLDQRRSQVAFAEKKIVAVEGRITDLRSMTEKIERKIQGIAAREGFIGAVKKEVATVHEISARSKVDLQHVAEQRGAIEALRVNVEKALKGIGETEERMAVIEAHRKLVTEVELKTNVISHMLADVRLNLETLSEQKSVIDHVIANLAGLNEMVQGAQATLKTLQTERELAERGSSAGSSSFVQRPAV